MSDFVTELRREVVTAHAHHRTAAARTTRRRRGPQLAWAIALAALLVAAVLIVRSVPQPDQSAEPRVVKVMRIGGEPTDGAFGDGSLWVTDYSGKQVVRIDPERREVVARIPLGEQADDIAADDESVWARGDLMHPRTRMWRIDPATNRVVTRADGGNRWLPEMADGNVWVFLELVDTPSLDRLSRRGVAVARIPFYRGAGLAGHGRWLWALANDGTVLRIDARRARVVHRWPRLAPAGTNLVGDAGDDGEGIVADADGAWVIGTKHQQIFRLEGNRVVRVLRTGPLQPILAYTNGALWVVANDDPGKAAIDRIDPRTGRVTGTVVLGSHYPRALVPAPGGVWVVAGDGTVVLVAG
jgi:DNA-binding beta-propeller fold protein YncE